VIPKLIARDVTIKYRRKRYGDVLVAVLGASFEVGEGEFVVIVGPSGCGKTTILSAIDGLTPISSGVLTLDGRQITKPGRDRAVVFQQPSLLPWRTVAGNVAYGLETHGGKTKAEVQKRSQEFIDLVGLHGFENAYPSELSGGMQQRTNLARALTSDPDVLLLDEPFGALDAQTREIMQGELLRIWSATRKTALFITHDIAEAVYLADRVIVMSARPGRIKLTVPIDLPRPRDLRLRRTAEFVALEARIWEEIAGDIARATEAVPA